MTLATGSGTGSRWLIGPRISPEGPWVPELDPADAPRRARARLASLASTDQTRPAESLLACPNSHGRSVIELYSGQVFPGRCRSNLCAYCLPRNARRRALAITYAKPRRMIRLSLVADVDTVNPCDTAKIRVALIRRNLKRVGLNPGEWTYTIERNPKGTGYHAHCLQTGPSIPQHELQIACEKAHAGIPFINAIRREGKWTSQYGLKGFGADGYGLKTFRSNADSQEALRINNGSLEHHSKLFYSVDGDRVRVREYESLAVNALNEGKTVAYLGCATSEVTRILGSKSLVRDLISSVHLRSAGKLRAMQ